MFAAAILLRKRVMARRIVSSAFVSLPEPAIAVVEDNFVLFASVIVGAFFLSSSRSKELGYWGYLIRQKLLGVGLPIRPWCLAETCSLEVPPP